MSGNQSIRRKKWRTIEWAATRFPDSNKFPLYLSPLSLSRLRIVSLISAAKFIRAISNTERRPVRQFWRGSKKLRSGDGVSMTTRYMGST